MNGDLHFHLEVRKIFAFGGSPASFHRNWEDK